MLILAGLQGGKGIPAEIANQPAVLVTLTAPSFGRVHRTRSKGGRRLPCRAGGARRCVHVNPQTCARTHLEDDPDIGEALCPECFDYERAILFNALAPELWRRLTVYTRRYVTALARASAPLSDAIAKVSFVKVIEYQRRGLVHIHAVARLDGESSRLGASVLMTALQYAAKQVSVACPGDRGLARFGEQLNLQLVGTKDADHRGAVAGYISKYATKSSDQAGAMDRRIRQEEELKRRALTPHFRRLAETAWRLGDDSECESLGLRRWAHTLGFRGHWLTKSRHWSTTFTHLRQERAEWRIAEFRRLHPEEQPTPPPRFSYAGSGWATPNEALVAAHRYRSVVEARRLGREELRSMAMRT